MRFSPDGAHLLGGTTDGSAGVYLDGLLVMGSAGYWCWTENRQISGPGGYNGTAQGPGFYQFTVGAGTPPALISPQLFSALFGDGNGHWLGYVADGRTGSFDSAGNRWPIRVALGISPMGDQIFTDQTGAPIIVRTQSGAETSYPTPPEWIALPSGGYFSRNARGCFGSLGVWYACGYLADPGGLCVWQPGQPATSTWLLSADGRDFNADIALRQSDGMLVVGSGVNQGETAQRLYELDLPNARFRVNAGAWQPLTAATSPAPPAPRPTPIVIAPLAHRPWLGPFDSRGEPHPGNCEVLTDGRSWSALHRPLPVFCDLASLPSVPVEYVKGIWTGFEGGRLDPRYDEAKRTAKERGVPLIVYRDADDYPLDFARAYCPGPNMIPCVRGYAAAKLKGQPLKATPEEDLARIRGELQALKIAGYKRIGQTHDQYTQSGNYPWSHIIAMQSGLHQHVVDFELFGNWWFTRWGRDPAEPIDGLPIMADVRRREAEAIPEDLRDQVPPILEPVPPSPPPSEPFPKPTPAPLPSPQPKEPTMPAGKYLVLFPSGTFTGGCKVTQEPHQDSTNGRFPGCCAFKRVADGYFANWNGVAVVFKNLNGEQPGSGERFFAAGNVALYQPDSGEPIAIPMSGAFGQ